MVSMGLGYLMIDGLPVPGDVGPTLISLATLNSLDIGECYRGRLR